MSDTSRPGFSDSTFSPRAAFGRLLRLLARLRSSAHRDELMLVALAAFLILFRLGSYSLVTADEAVYHAIAERMLESGNGFRLDFLMEHRIYDTFLNAPLQYWARALLIGLFGSSLWTARILSGLFGVASVWITYRLCASLGDRRSALLAGLVQLTTLQFLFLHSARTGELEPVLTFFLPLAALTFQRAINGTGRFASHHACVAVIANLKLPLALIPILAELAYFALTPDSRQRFAAWLRSALWILPLGLCWHVGQAFALWEELPAVVGAMAGHASGSLVPGDSTPFSNAAYYARTLLFGAFPYTLFYPLALIMVLAPRRSGTGSGTGSDTSSGRGAGKENADAIVRWRLPALYAAAVFAFFLLVGKHAPWYIIPAYPFLSIFLGRWLAGLFSRRPRTPELLAIAGITALTAGFALDFVAFNPFAGDAFRLATPVELVGLAGLEPAWSLSLASLLLFGLLIAGRRALGQRFARTLGLVLVSIMIGVAGVRVCLPLRHLGHQSQLAQLHALLQSQRESGGRITHPVPIPSANLMLIRVYFAADYRVRLAPGRGGQAGASEAEGALFELVEKELP